MPYLQGDALSLLTCSNFKKWLTDNKSGKHWLHTGVGVTWLQSEDGQKWLKSPNGIMWLNVPKDLLEMVKS